MASVERFSCTDDGFPEPGKLMRMVADGRAVRGFMAAEPLDEESGRLRTTEAGP